MKKTLLTIAAAAVLAGSAFGQGQVTMANNNSSLITYLGNPVAIGSTSFQLTWGVAAGPDGSLTPIGAVVGVNGSAAGRIATLTTPVNGLTPGANLFFQILAWQGSSLTYAGALATDPKGFSTQFQSLTSADTSPPSTAVNLAGKYPGFALTTAVPEPSTLALLGLGAASLLAFRRRK